MSEVTSSSCVPYFLGWLEWPCGLCQKPMREAARIVVSTINIITPATELCLIIDVLGPCICLFDVLICSVYVLQEWLARCPGFVWTQVDSFYHFAETLRKTIKIFGICKANQLKMRFSFMFELSGRGSESTQFFLP